MSAVNAGTLVVGAGQAGLQLVTSLRELGERGPITLVGAEPHAPYERPPLSKGVLTGLTDVASLAFHPLAHYSDDEIELVLDDQVTRLVADRSGAGGQATTASGRQLRYARLALTTGAAPRGLSVLGEELDGVCRLRDRDDATDLRTRLLTARRVVVVGGGYIGLEAAVGARAAGAEVTVVETADRLLARSVSPLVSEFYRQAHERRGTRVLLARRALAFEGAAGSVTEVLLSDGSALAADVVLVGAGAVPRTGLAEQLGLDCDGGIVVDAHARTSDPRVVAAGDCTVQPDPRTGLGRVRLESVQNAVAQARTAAASLLDLRSGPASVPWFWSDQGDLALQSAGLAAGYDEQVVRGDPDHERFSVLYYLAGRLLAVDAVNAPADYLAVRRALTRGRTIRADRARDVTVALRTLVEDVPAG